MFSKKTRILSGILASALAITTISAVAFVSAENLADPKLTDKFVLAQDFELAPTNATFGDLKITEGVGVNSSKAGQIDIDSSIVGKKVYTIDLSAAPIAPGAGAEELWFNLNTAGVTLVKGWIIAYQGDKSFSVDDDSAGAPAEGVFYQQAADGTWSEQPYQANDNGCFNTWNGTGYTRIKLSDFNSGSDGYLDVTKPITKLEIHLKTAIYGDGGDTYPADSKMIFDNFGFSGKDLVSDTTVDEFLNPKSETTSENSTSETTSEDSTSETTSEDLTSETTSEEIADVKGIQADLINAVFADDMVTDSTENVEFSTQGTVKLGDVNVKFDGKDYTTKGLEIANSGGNVKGIFYDDRATLAAKLNQGFTLEAFYVDETPGGVHGIFCATQFEGFGLATKNNGLPYFLGHIGGGYKLANGAQDGPTDSLTHVLGVFDNVNGQVKLYVNGVLVESTAATGDLLLARGDMFKTIFLGADPKEGAVDENGKEIVDYQMVNAKIVSARAYGAAFTDEDATKAFNAAVARLKGLTVVDEPYNNGTSTSEELSSEEPTSDVTSIDDQSSEESSEISSEESSEISSEESSEESSEPAPIGAEIKVEVVGEVAAGNEVTVKVNIPADLNFAAGALKLTYDKDLLAITTNDKGKLNVTGGDMDGATINAKNAGEIIVAYATTDPLNYAGSILEVTFKIADTFTAESEAKINVEITEMWDIDKNAIENHVVQTSIKTPDVTSEESTDVSTSEESTDVSTSEESTDVTTPEESTDVTTPVDDTTTPGTTSTPATSVPNTGSTGVAGVASALAITALAAAAAVILKKKK